MWLLSFGLDWVVLNRTIGAMSIFSVLSGADRSSIAEAKPCLAMSRVILRAIFALYLGHPWWGPQADRKIWFSNWLDDMLMSWLLHCLLLSSTHMVLACRPDELQYVTWYMHCRMNADPRSAENQSWQKIIPLTRLDSLEHLQARMSTRPTY